MGARQLALFVLAALATGCGGRPPCLVRQHATPAEIAASPRGDRALEALAAELAGTIAPDPAIYERLVRDVGAMHAADPSIAHVTYRLPHDGRTLYVEADSYAEPRILSGLEPTFEAVRRIYPPASVEPTGPGSGYRAVVVTYDAVYDLVRLRELFRDIEGVADVGLNVMMGDGPSLCVEPGEARWTYVFLDASGDCPAGCIDMRLVVFESDASGAVTRIGESAAVGDAGEVNVRATECLRAHGERAARPTEHCATEP